MLMMWRRLVDLKMHAIMLIQLYSMNETSSNMNGCMELPTKCDVCKQFFVFVLVDDVCLIRIPYAAI